jgi:D-aspartate ligase
MDFKIIKEKYILSFVPKIIIKKYIKNKLLKNEINKLIKNKKIVNPLKYKNDKNLKRKLYLFYRDLNYIKKYKKYNF